MLAMVLLAADQSAPLTATTECRNRPESSSSYWSWRLIDNRKCWFRGRASMDKRLLYWATNPAPLPPEREEKPHVPLALPKAPAIAGEFELRWRDMLIDLYTPYWTDKTPIEQWKGK